MTFLDKLLTRSPPAQASYPSAAEVAYRNPLPLPFSQDKSLTKETIEYMTQNPSMPGDVKNIHWGFDLQFLSFGNLKDWEVNSILEDYEIYLLKRRNWDPSFKNNPQAILAAEQLRSVIKSAGRKSTNAEFLKRMSSAVSITESRQSFKQEEERRKGGILGMIGLG